jgi:hypothetical protein
LFRLQHSPCQGFPVRGLIAACHALRPIPPSSNRTCGFPASGSPESSRLRLAQMPLLLGHSAQLRPYWGVGISRYRVVTQAVLLFLFEACSQQGPFAPLALPSFFATMGPSDSRSGISHRASQVPRLFFRRTPSHPTPKSQKAALPQFFTFCSGFIFSDRLTTLALRNEA